MNAITDISELRPGVLLDLPESPQLDYPAGTYELVSESEYSKVGNIWMARPVGTSMVPINICFDCIFGSEPDYNVRLP